MFTNVDTVERESPNLSLLAFCSFLSEDMLLYTFHVFPTEQWTVISYTCFQKIITPLFRFFTSVLSPMYRQFWLVQKQQILCANV
jgi:hypothetical protein